MMEDPSNPKSIVFVTQYIRNIKFSDAERFGEVRFLTEREFRPAPAPVMYNMRIQHEIIKNLKDYMPGTDYILLTGSGVPNFVVGSLLGAMNRDHKILKWDNRQHRYEVFEIHS